MMLIEKVARKGKITRQKIRNDEKNKGELGKRPYRPGSPLAVVDDPSNIAVPYDRDGATGQHGSPEAVSSENEQYSHPANV